MNSHLAINFTQEDDVDVNMLQQSLHVLLTLLHFCGHRDNMLGLGCPWSRAKSLVLLGTIQALSRSLSSQV